MWDLSSLTRDRTHTLALEVQSLNHWTTWRVPGLCLLTFCLPLASLPSQVLGPLWLPQLNGSLSHYCRLSSRRSGPVSHHRECLPWLSFLPAVDPLSPPPPNEGQREPLPGKGLWRRGREALCKTASEALHPQCCEEGLLGTDPCKEFQRKKLQVKSWACLRNSSYLYSLNLCDSLQKTMREQVSCD